MNEKKIAFITCVNNEIEYAESLYYMERLVVPEGYVKDIIAVREAPSMTAGYNAAMKSSDAKYKVYLHQDVFIIDKDFIFKLLSTFQAEKELGMLGCVGCDNLPLHAKAVEVWNAGMVYHNCTPSLMGRIPREDGAVTYVEALDGLLLATQYDVEWREDLFDGWDFYDISQCFEMQRAGYRVATIFQQSPMCYHDNTYSKMGNYNRYCAKFVAEYQDVKPFVDEGLSTRIAEYELLKEKSREDLKALVDAGAKEELLGIFAIPENKGYLHLRDFEVLATIEQMERKAGISQFWNMGESYETLADKIRKLKFAIKRVEYQADEDGKAMEFIVSQFSVWAIDVVYSIYEVYRPKVWDEIMQNGRF